MSKDNKSTSTLFAFIGVGTIIGVVIFICVLAVYGWNPYWDDVASKQMGMTSEELKHFRQLNKTLPSHLKANVDE